MTTMKKFVVCATIFSFLFVSPVIAKTLIPDTPQQVVATQQSGILVDQGRALLNAGNPDAAEGDFRAALVLGSWNAEADAGLAEALTAQGRTAEALRLYRTLIYTYPRNLSSVAQDHRILMHYVILLSQLGQWEEAVSIYEKVLPDTTHFGDAPRIDVHFDPRVPMPIHLQAMAYVVSGMEYTGHGETTDAFREYEKASHLAPDSPFANYYYGYGWQVLDPKAKMLHQEQAKAAFAKAVQLGKGDLKKAAEKALKDLNKPANKPA